MRSGRVIIGISCIITSSLLYAGSLGSIPAWSAPIRPVVSFFTGVVGINANNQSLAYASSNDNLYVYHHQGGSNTNAFVGAFLGIETRLPQPKFFIQTGVEYSYFGNTPFKGVHSVGVEPATSTRYNYHYYVQTQQVLAVAKLFTTATLPVANHPLLYPYVSVGLGAAFNDAGQYSATTAETGSINLTPMFKSHTQTDFSYSVGLGVETNVNPHARLGLGYRFASFGNASLGSGQVALNHYTFPVPFTLNMPNTYANQFVMQISYLA